MKRCSRVRPRPFLSPENNEQEFRISIGSGEEGIFEFIFEIFLFLLFPCGEDTQGN